MDRNIKLNFNSTLEGYVLILTCDNYLTSNINGTDERILKVTCYSNTTNWIPDPADFIESCSLVSTTTTTTTTTTLPGIERSVFLANYFYIYNISPNTCIQSHILLQYSRKYWQELNLAVGPKLPLQHANIGGFKFGSSVRDRHT